MAGGEGSLQDLQQEHLVMDRARRGGALGMRRAGCDAETHLLEGLKELELPRLVCPGQFRVLWGKDGSGPGPGEKKKKKQGQGWRGE